MIKRRELIRLSRWALGLSVLILVAIRLFVRPAANEPPASRLVEVLEERP